ncbi:pachytene checkpoint protein 2 homolog [Anopheles darlingi]|uniref:pachytene checkpoint protein 2 homolog n=1 Tax=Anopheles darlingi TaxID=43151 RepID=UPI0021002A5F|nr:pachytene checkpoint protein 2 homolog [Anopheles darlingi]
MCDTIQPILIEVACSRGFNKTQQRAEVFTHVHEFLVEQEEIAIGTAINIPVKCVQQVLVCTNVDKFMQRSALQFHFYVLHEGEAEEETIEHGGQTTAIAQHLVLPSRELHGLWESLIYEEDIKQGMLSFAETSMLFSRRGVNNKLIACNRMALFHGPPGTGKTSFCRAIAQKLAIRLNETYKHAHLLEINSHSLFSRWFSESGKLVQKAFSQVIDLLQDPNALVCLLIDEVESLAFERSKISNNEPTDSIRVVNAVLTQLDRIRRFPNAFVLATSNMMNIIDTAFLDRADFVQYIGYPTEPAIYEIYRMALQELIDVKIIQEEEEEEDPAKRQIIPSYTEATQPGRCPCTVAEFLLQLVRVSEGLSGRALRKIPFLAHALFVKRKTETLLNYMITMRQTVRKYRSEQTMLGRETAGSISLQQKTLNGHTSSPNNL